MISFVPDDSLAEGEFPGGENISSVHHSQEKGQEEAEVEQSDVKGVERTHDADSEIMERYKNTAKCPVLSLYKNYRIKVKPTKYSK